MAVKFSQFTEATDASTITKIVGYIATGSLNVQIPPANLDTTYVVSTTSGAAPVVNLTATKTGSTATSSLLNFTGSGGTTLTGTAGTSTIDISSVDTNTTYTLPAGGTAAAATLTLTGSDSTSDIVTLTGGTGITFSSITDGGFTIDGSNIVSVSAESIDPITDAVGSNRSMNIGTNVAGAVSVNAFKFSGANKPGSVVSDNVSNNNLFLKGDGSWATPSTGGYTTQVVASATTVSAVKDYLYILTNTSTVTITLPASPSDGDTIGIANNFVTSGGNVTNKLVANGTGGNKDKIMGATTDLVIDNGSAAFDLVFSSANAPTGNGWTIVGAN